MIFSVYSSQLDFCLDPRQKCSCTLTPWKLAVCCFEIRDAPVRHSQRSDPPRISTTREQFDLVILSIYDQPWHLGSGLKLWFSWWFWCLVFGGHSVTQFGNARMNHDEPSSRSNSKWAWKLLRLFSGHTFEVYNKTNHLKTTWYDDSVMPIRVAPCPPHLWHLWFYHQHHGSQGGLGARRVSYRVGFPGRATRIFINGLGIPFRCTRTSV